MDEFESLDPVPNEFQTSCLKYIAGFVQSKLSLKLKFKTCTDVITSSAPDRDRLCLTFMKDRDGLTFASHQLSKVAEIAESKIQDAKMNEKLFFWGGPLCPSPSPPKKCSPCGVLPKIWALSVQPF